MTRIAIACLSAFLMAGCASAFDAIARVNNQMDACQHPNPPNYCGAGKASAIIRNPNGQVIGKVYQ